MTYFTRPFFTLVETFYTVLPLVVIIDLIAIYLLIFKEKMDPRSFAFWIVLVIVLPFLGFALYLIYGCNLYSTSIFGRKLGRDREFGLMDDPRIRGADTPTFGNDVRFYTGDEQWQNNVLRDLESAQNSIHIEIYTMPSKSLFPDLVDTLCQKSKEGVDIRFLMGRGIPRTLNYLRALTRSGVKFMTFHRRFFSLVSTSFRFRNHRLMVIIDGRVAYSGEQSFVRLEGPSASRLDARFLADWSFAKGEPPEQVWVSGEAGDTRVQVVSSGPDVGNEVDPAMMEYVSMIKSAKRSIVLSEPYLVPDENIYNFIKLAALSDVDVSLIVSDSGRHWYQHWNTMSASWPLIDSGARIFLSEKRFKDSQMCVDGMISAVGLPPFNSRVMLQDFHTSIIVESEEISHQVTEYLYGLTSSATELKKEDFEHRSLSVRIKTGLSRILMFFN